MPWEQTKQGQSITHEKSPFCGMRKYATLHMWSAKEILRATHTKELQNSQASIGPIWGFQPCLKSEKYAWRISLQMVLNNLNWHPVSTKRSEYGLEINKGVRIDGRIGQAFFLCAGMKGAWRGVVDRQKSCLLLKWVWLKHTEECVCKWIHWTVCVLWTVSLPSGSDMVRAGQYSRAS